MAKIHVFTLNHKEISNQIVTEVEIKNPVTGNAVKSKGIWDTGATKRTRKQWFTDVFYKEIKRLTAIMAEKYSMKAARIVVINSLEKD